MSCTVDNPVDANYVVVSYSQSDDDTHLTLNIPNNDDYLISNIYSCFCFKQ